MLKHTLVPLDGSPLSELALSYARKITDKGGTITLVSVVDLPTNQAYFVYDVPVIEGVDSLATTEKIKKYTQDYLNKRAEQLNDEGFKAHVMVEVGYPENVIVELAQRLEVDAIVMSTHGRSGLDRILFGSVTQRVINTMPCPVFVIPNKMTQKESHGTDSVEYAN